MLSLIPKDSEIVLCHNDAQENNILASLHDLTQTIFIDFEYTSWNPRAMDLANYFNEVMLDNAHPLGNGIKDYVENCMTDSEQTLLVSEYLTQYWAKYHKQQEGETQEQFLEREAPKLLKEARACMLLNNYFWAIWAMHILKEERLGDPTVFNFGFVESRIRMQLHVKQLYFS